MRNQTEFSLVIINGLMHHYIGNAWIVMGQSRIGIYHNTETNQFRIVGRKLDNYDVVANCIINESFCYNKATTLFHQWRNLIDDNNDNDNSKVYGVKFFNMNDSQLFGDTVDKIMDSIEKIQQLTAATATMAINNNDQMESIHQNNANIGGQTSVTSFSGNHFVVVDDNVYNNHHNNLQKHSIQSNHSNPYQQQPQQQHSSISSSCSSSSTLSSSSSSCSSSNSSNNNTVNDISQYIIGNSSNNSGNNRTIMNDHTSSISSSMMNNECTQQPSSSYANGVVVGPPPPPPPPPPLPLIPTVPPHRKIPLKPKISAKPETLNGRSNSVGPFYHNKMTQSNPNLSALCNNSTGNNNSQRPSSNLIDEMARTLAKRRAKIEESESNSSANTDNNYHQSINAKTINNESTPVNQPKQTSSPPQIKCYNAVNSTIRRLNSINNGTLNYNRNNTNNDNNHNGNQQQQPQNAGKPSPATLNAANLRMNTSQSLINIANTVRNATITNGHNLSRPQSPAPPPPILPPSLPPSGQNHNSINHHNNSISYDRLKDEIMKEFRQELTQFKQDLISAIRAEIFDPGYSNRQ